MVQTGFKAEAHCWKCFKENVDMTLMDGKAMNLCKGCLYVVKQLSQWLNAYGLGVRQIIVPGLEIIDGILAPDGGSEEEGKKGVSRGKKGSELMRVDLTLNEPGEGPA